MFCKQIIKTHALFALRYITDDLTSSSISYREHLSCSIHRFGLTLHLEGLLDVHQETFQMQRKTERDGENVSWISEQAARPDDDDIVAMYETIILRVKYSYTTAYKHIVR